MGVLIKDYIKFMDFNSKIEKLYLMSREAPTPKEKEVLKNLPYQQGVLDFSSLLGDRSFENREITYEFLYLETDGKRIATLETNLKKRLMQHGRNPIFDSHDPKYYWLGKCKSVTAEKDSGFQRLKVTIVFDCYPYMIRRTNYFDDYWDTFDFNDDIAIYTKYVIKGSLDFPFYNASSVSVRPDIIVDSRMTITINDGDPVTISPGDKKDYYLSLRTGNNVIHVEGNGILQIHHQWEVMG